MKKTVIWAVAGFLTAATLLLAGMWLRYSRDVQEIEKQGGNAAVYDRHYAFISEDSSPMWQSVYEKARTAAAKENTYLEWVGKDSLANYQAQDCMRISIASQVDGIFLYPDGSDEIRSLIDEAATQGIPVITVMNDDSASKRISFVGVNNYQMGEIYGEQVLKLLQEGNNHIMVLLSSAMEDVNTNLLYAQMNKVIEQGKAPGQKVISSAYTIDNSTNFDAEEVIRDIFVTSSALPDILVCLDTISTECACQALVDYNQVGNIDIIGYYASDATLDAIQKGLMGVTVALNEDEIGEDCISAMNEYLELGYVSNYFNVGMTIVTKENVNQYLQQQGSPSENTMPEE